MLFTIFTFFSFIFSSVIALDITLTDANIENSGGLRDALDQINATPGATNSITIPFATLTGQLFNLPPIEITNANSLTHIPHPFSY